MKAMIVYHDKCTDGFTAAWIAWHELRKQGYDCVLQAAQYNKTIDFSEHVDVIYVVDFSLPIHVINSLSHTPIVIIDHHKTAFETYFPDLAVEADTRKKGRVGHAIVELDNAECGASLTYIHFKGHTDQLPVLIAYVKDRDLWLKNYGEDTDILAHWLREQETTIKNWDFISRRLEAQDPTLWEEAITMYELHKESVKHCVANSVPLYLHGIRGKVAIASNNKLSSDVGNILAERTQTFGAVVQRQGKDFLVSLRSCGDIDVSEIAKSYGGGGHANAAGFTAKYGTDLSIMLEVAFTDWEGDD